MTSHGGRGGGSFVVIGLGEAAPARQAHDLESGRSLAVWLRRTVWLLMVFSRLALGTIRLAFLVLRRFPLQLGQAIFQSLPDIDIEGAGNGTGNNCNDDRPY